MRYIGILISENTFVVCAECREPGVTVAHRHHIQSAQNSNILSALSKISIRHHRHQKVFIL
jgi:hypothetical protein